MASYSYLQILELYLGLFLDTIFPCSVETLKGSIYGFSHTLFTLCHFETKRGSIFCFWTKIVFLTGQVIFVIERPKWEFVSL
jgi:hypothetical protein